MVQGLARNLIEIGLAGILFSGTACSTSTATPAPLGRPSLVPAATSATLSIGMTTAPPKITLQSVRQGINTPQQYIDDVVQRTPELRAEKLLAGVLYDPSVSALLEKFRQDHAPNPELEKKLEDLISDYASNGFISADRFLKVTIFPSVRGLYASRIPLYIVLPQNFLYSTSNSNDNDVASTLKHEKQHAKDISEGISYNASLSISSEDLQSGLVNPEFFSALLEHRGYYVQLDLYFRAEIGIDPARYTDLFTISNIIGYANAGGQMTSSAVSPKEKALLHAQLERSKGIVASKLTNGSIDVKFDLYGRQDALAVKK